MAINITPDRLAADIEKRLRELPKAINRGMKEAGSKAVTDLKTKTPRDTGNLRNGWEKKQTLKGVTVQNNAPYAGIVEKGARPHGVNSDGIDSLTEWAQRKLGLNSEDARNAAFAIARKMKEEGQEPTFFVKNMLEELTEDLRIFVEKELQQLARKPL